MMKFLSLKTIRIQHVLLFYLVLIFSGKLIFGYILNNFGTRELLSNKRITLNCQNGHQIIEFAETSEIMYNKCMSIKCPFFRRRAIDLVETALSLYKFVILTRHKSIDIPGIRLENYNQHLLTISKKTPNLCINQIRDMLLSDWRGKNQIEFDGKGYYITGLLTRSIYRDDCFFDGPDPDMPVKGLKKYLLSVSNLFDRKKSRADLIRPLIIDEESRTIQAFWRLEGVLNLPWHPTMKPWTGNTIYYLDSVGLIERHVEHWDISVMDAFISTLLPGLHFGAPPADPAPSPATFFTPIDSYNNNIIGLHSVLTNKETMDIDLCATNYHDCDEVVVNVT
mmetsp:Transcript_31111/g.44716  ORF Transcript_31111/g.44716 Transcript_31111/m.44716 type:complete len:337 (-) Transcript_31111:54-1064(-)